MRRACLFISTLTLAACGTEPVNTQITRNPQYARFRVIDLQPTDSNAFYVMLPDELPVTLPLAPIAPGASGFTQQVAGAWVGYVSQSEKTLTSASQMAAVGQELSAVITTTGASGAPVVNWTVETFTPSEQASVRLISGVAGLSAGAATFGSAALPGTLAPGVPTDWLAVTPGTADLTVTFPDGSKVTYAGARLAAGELRTFLLTPSSPAPKLTSIKEPTSGDDSQAPTVLTQE